MGVGGEANRLWIRQRKLPRNMLLSLWNYLRKDRSPLIVDVKSGITPGLAMRLFTTVGPHVMAMRSEVKPGGVGLQEAREEVLVAVHGFAMAPVADSNQRDDYTSAYGRTPST